MNGWVALTGMSCQRGLTQTLRWTSGPALRVDRFQGSHCGVTAVGLSVPRRDPL